MRYGCSAVPGFEMRGYHGRLPGRLTIANAPRSLGLRLSSARQRISASTSLPLQDRVRRRTGRGRTARQDVPKSAAFLQPFDNSIMTLHRERLAQVSESVYLSHPHSTMLEWARILLRATHKAPTYSHVVDLPSTMCESVEPPADGSHFRWDAMWTCKGRLQSLSSALAQIGREIGRGKS